MPTKIIEAETTPQTTMITAIHLSRAKASQREIARHLEKEISSEENSGTQAIDFVAESQLSFHLEGGKSDIDAIQVGDDVEKKQERQQPPRKLGDDVGAEVNSS